MISNTQTGTDAQLDGRWLILARLAWVALAVLIVGLYLIGIPMTYATYQTVCTAFPSCANLQLTESLARQLPSLGLSIQGYALYFTLVINLVPLLFFLVAVLIFWRKSENRMALFVSLMLLTWGGGGWIGTSNDPNSLLHWIEIGLQALGNTCIALFILIFPDGRFAPRWVRWVAPFIIARELLGVLTDNPIIQYAFFVEVPLGIFIQLYKYRRVSTPVQREQTKWVIFGLVAGITGYAGILIYVFTTMPKGQPDSVISYLVGGTLLGLFILLIPVSFGMAILRSHLWDIDVIIRRTLIYSVLTAILALFYFGSVTVIQQVLSALTGQRSDIAIIASTLAIAALFVPLHARVQRTIDHRFYRRKYDAAQVLATFAGTVRDEVDLNRLTDELLTVVEETMQPQQASLWLKPGPVEKGKAQ